MTYSLRALLRVVAESQRRHRPRDRAIVHLAAAGLAPHEIASLTWDDVRERGIAGAVIEVANRHVSLGPEGASALRGYRRRGGGRLIPLTPRGVKGVLERLRSRLRPRQTRRDRLRQMGVELLVLSGIPRSEVSLLVEKHSTPPPIEPGTCPARHL